MTEVIDTKTGEIVDPLTSAEEFSLEQYEEIIDAGLKTFVEVGDSLATIRNARLYRAGHGTFEAYCEERWNLTRTRAYELISAAEIVAGVSEISDIVPANEGQARQLRGLEPAEAAVVLRRAHEATAGNVTAAAIYGVRHPAPKTSASVAPEAPARETSAISQTDVEAAPTVGADDSQREATANAVPPAAEPDVIGEYLDGSQELHDAEYLNNFYKAISKTSEYRQFDAERIARLANADDIKTLELEAKYADEFLKKVQRARSGLRVITGGRA